MLSSKFKFPTSALAIFVPIIITQDAHAESQPVQAGSTVITSVDVEELLAKSLQLNRARRSAEDSGCPGGGGAGGGFRAKRYCYWDVEFRDLAIDKIISVSVGDVELSKIPAYYKYEHAGFENCWSNRVYPFDEDVTYKSTQGVTVGLNEVLTKIKDYSSELDVNASILNYVGVRENDKIGMSIKYELTKSSTKSLQDEFELRQHIKYDIPAMTASWAYYSDEKRDVTIPITITGVITGRVVDHSSYNTDNDMFRLADRPESVRTFTIHGHVEFLGSNRSLDVKTGDRPLTAEYCAKASPPPHQ